MQLKEPTPKPVPDPKGKLNSNFRSDQGAPRKAWQRHVDEEATRSWTKIGIDPYLRRELQRESNGNTCCSKSEARVETT